MLDSRTFEITGSSPILMHAYPLQPIEAFDKLPAATQAEYATYRDPDTRELYVPGIAFQRALVSGATYSKGKGRASLQRVAAACLVVNPERMGLGTKDFTLDSRAVVMPATKGRVVRHRPRLDEWKIAGVIEWDPTLITEQQVRRIVDDTGTRVGILDFRPEKKGPFGRFTVTTWGKA